MRFLQSLKTSLELRRLRRRLPYAYRRFVWTDAGVRPETDYEYVVRLRGIHTERRGQSRQRDETQTRGFADD